MNKVYFLLSLIVCALSMTVCGAGTFRLDSQNGVAVFDSRNASLLRLETSNGTIPFKSLQGIWSLTFADGKTISAANFTPEQIKVSGDAKRKEYLFENGDVKVLLSVAARNGFLDLQAEVTAKTKNIKEFSLPGKVVFQSADVKGIVTQATWPRNVGMKLNRAFFESRAAKDDIRWKRGSVIGGGLYAAVFDGRPPRNLFPSRKLSAPQITSAGQEWLGKELAGKLAARKVFATRPFNKDQAKIVLADTADGVFLGGMQYNSKGYCFRVGGFYQDKDKALRREITIRLAQEAARKNGRNKIAVVAFPMIEFWDKDDIDATIRLLKLRKIPYEVISTPTALVKMLAENKIGGAINCNGEHCPMPANMPYREFAKRLRSFMSAGGSWIEYYGYSFHYRLAPDEYLSFKSTVPCAAADLFVFEMTTGKFSVYSVQKLATKPNWDVTDIYVPSRHTFSGSKDGGVFEHTFLSYIRKGQKVKLPVVRIRYGTNALEAANAFCTDNEAVKTLEEKLPGSKFQRFANAVIYKTSPATVADGIRHCKLLPPGGFIHFSNFMKHGFDIGLPETFPPNPKFGTPAEFRKMVDHMREKGFLFMPYINNTWWGTYPVKSDYFKKHGEGALLRTEKNTLWFEKYGNKHGFAITMWHPDVRKANRLITDALVNDYPADLIFQDQIGGRGSMLDFNPASPVPYAYAQGMINTVREDAARAPLACEDGWYGVMDNMVMFCGASFGLTEPRASSAWEFIYERWPKDTFQLYSLLGAIAHDKVILSHHNLGGYVHNSRQLALTLGLGYTLILRANLEINGKERELLEPPFLEYAKFADALQRNIVSAYIGKPQKSFEHQWSKDDVGVIRAKYGDVTVISNMDKSPLECEYGTVAPHCFYAATPDAVAGYPAAYPGSAFIARRDKVWLFCKNGTEMEFPLLDPAVTKAVCKNGEVIPLERNGKNVKIRLKAGDASYNRFIELKLIK
ncbi:MAG: hypothetical protein IJZ19_06580 [Lentisphaeria bacterium]|nr:hypothetical protein [Lentisphaeria bacterium]